MMPIRHLMALSLGLCLTLAACSPSAGTEAAPTVTAVLAPTDTAAAPPQAEPSATRPAATPAAGLATPAGQDLLRLVLVPEQSEARYLVREQLASLSLPSDAVGTTSAVSGTLVIGADGTIVSSESSFVVDLRTLRSDSSMRDGYIQRTTLETGQYPNAEFIPAEAIGLPSPLPASGEVSFQLAGDMTVHGVTRPTTWDVTAQIVDGQALVGTAATSFTFGDFGMTAPQVARVLSIEDNIRLELDFHLALTSPASS